MGVRLGSEVGLVLVLGRCARVGAGIGIIEGLGVGAGIGIMVGV